ncbi:MAG: hypothetical protein U0350_48080 [Caldilineaceae bacterium]
MQAQMTSIHKITARQLRSQNPTRPLPEALADFIRWSCKAHLLTFLLLLFGPILLAPVFDGDANAFFVVTPSFDRLIQTLLDPVYKYFTYLVGLQVASLAASTIAWQALSSGRTHWSVHGFTWLVAGFSGASLLVAFTPFGMTGLLLAFTLLIWVAILVIGAIAALGSIIIIGVLLLLCASTLVFSAVVISNRRRDVYEYRTYRPPYESHQHFQNYTNRDE